MLQLSEAKMYSEPLNNELLVEKHAGESKLEVFRSD